MWSDNIDMPIDKEQCRAIQKVSTAVSNAFHGVVPNETYSIDQLYDLLNDVKKFEKGGKSDQMITTLADLSKACVQIISIKRDK